MAPEVKLNSVRMQRAYRFNNIETAKLQEFVKVLEKNYRYEKRVKEEESRLVECTIDRIKDSSGLSPQSGPWRELEVNTEEERTVRVRSAPVQRVRAKSGKSERSSGESGHPRRPMSTMTSVKDITKAPNLRSGEKDLGKSVKQNEVGDTKYGKMVQFSGIGRQFGAKKGWADVGTPSPDLSDDDNNDDEDGSTVCSDDSDDDVFQVKPKTEKDRLDDAKNGSRKNSNSASPSTSRPTTASILLGSQGQSVIRPKTSGGSRRRQSTFMTPSQALLMRQVTSVRRLEKCRLMVEAERNYQHDVLQSKLEEFKELYPIPENTDKLR